uniref:NADH dehydrogenase subunit 4L n=1 Tax=Welwitschia mirabilis TaxID=3377 RepID=A0A109PUR1_WELMI|nr:NADH dehydrogense subunit 4 [Welwitschia mirabilis]AMA20993.1 NADH dehydrogense subunit 4 [Welwitschia mirabilis]QXE44329.1 NADH dehydrogenase subunit 4L [Welwitschia mirabilis]
MDFVAHNYNEGYFGENALFLELNNTTSSLPIAISTIFIYGIWGVFLNRRNIIKMLMSIELMLLAVLINLLVKSVYMDDTVGQLKALFVLTVAAAESAIGLAILVITNRIRGTIAVELCYCIKG